MNGFGNQTTNPQQPIENVNYWDLDTQKFTSSIIPGTNTTTTVAGNFAGGFWGPEVKFARRLASEEIPNTYLFKFAVADSYVTNKKELPNAKVNEPYETNLYSWNPSAPASTYTDASTTTLWTKFKDNCEAIIANLGESNIRNVTLLWNQGESEAYAGQNNDEVALQFSALTSYFLDSVSGIFSGAQSFNIIRVKTHVNFASGSEPSWDYYPSGLYKFRGDDPANNVTSINGLEQFRYGVGGSSTILSEQYPTTLYASVSATSSAGFYGEFSFSSTPEIRLQQEALPSSVYGPLISMDDQSIDEFGLVIGGENFTLASASLYTVFGNLSAHYKALESLDLSNIHYKGDALDVMGERLYNEWVSLTNPSKIPYVFNNYIVVARNYTDDTANFSGSYDISATHRNFSSTYNSVPGYPAPNHARLEMKPTTVNTVSANSIQVHDLGHYLNGASKASPYELIWNVVGTFPPSGYQGWDFFVLSGDVTGDDVRDATEVFVFSGQLEGVFNADQVMDKDGYLTVSPLSGLDDNLSAIGSPTKGSAFSGGALVYSSTTHNPDNGTTLLAVRLKGGDGIALALFGGLNHLGVWCLDMKAMLKEGLTPPFAWDHLDNLRRYKLVSKVSFWDNLMYHKDSGGGKGLNAFSNPFNYGGPVYTLKFKFT
jgi:hypothetical protein